MPLDDSDRAVQEARLARARSRSVFICTPIARHPVRQYTIALARTFAHLLQLGIRGYIQTVVGSSNLPHARNELVASFLASDYTDLLWIDDDMGWEPNDVVRLLASDKQVIGAVGAKKRYLPDQNPEKWCVRIAPGRTFLQDEMGAIQVDGIGTAFLRIQRSVFEVMAAEHPEWKRRGFPTMPEDARRWMYRFYRFGDDEEGLGEDFLFCREWMRLGGSVWADPAIRLVHVGEAEFTGNFGVILEPEAQ
jgi:hypothetical protein